MLLIKEKICSSCGEKKSIEFFGRDCSKKDGLYTKCKICKKNTDKEYRKSNKSKIKDILAKYYQIHKDKLKNRAKDYRQKNKAIINEKKKIYHKERRKKDPLYKLIGNLRHRTNLALKSKNFSKNSKLIQYIGCDLSTLFYHLELQFPPNVTWNNFYDLCEIDHIIPLCSASTEEEVYHLCHYTNLRPLLKQDHYKKSQVDRILYKKR